MPLLLPNYTTSGGTLYSRTEKVLCGLAGLGECKRV
jgi:hypothetical protein